MISQGLRRMTSAAVRVLVAAGLGLFCMFLAGSAASAEVIDRIAAVVDQQVITLSEINQMIEIRFFPRRISTTDDDYRHDVLEALIAQTLRLRDVQRSGSQDVSKDSIEARVREIEKRFSSPAEFAAAMQHAELTLEDVRALVKRQLQVESYIQDRFAPLIAVSSDEIQNYYETTWSQQRRERGLGVPPLADVREEIRSLLKSTQLQSRIDEWTAALRASSNIDVYTWHG